MLLTRLVTTLASFWLALWPTLRNALFLFFTVSFALTSVAGALPLWVVGNWFEVIKRATDEP
ncbi:hypothetical protein [Deinococcus aquaedulcis]|uniref:hypothetical protein n=1 Tax=Deinococcus aquaedulcis TaxID=2840455 RepID=UPI001C82C2F2|nr:hypothetical protein [Deinococcus aquaedulcis]